LRKKGSPLLSVPYSTNISVPVVHFVQSRSAFVNFFTLPILKQNRFQLTNRQSENHRRDNSLKRTRTSHHKRDYRKHIDT